MAQRSRKRGRRGKAQPGNAPAATRVRRTPPAAAPESTRAPESVDRIGGWKVEKPMTRSQRRDAAVRAGLVPLRPGERPVAILIATAVSALLSVGNLIALAAGLKVGGKHPAAGGVVLLSAVFLVCAAGLWRLWYGAVLGFMALLAIVAAILSLSLLEATNALYGLGVFALIIGLGWLFFKLVRVLSRIQMPRPPGR